MSVPGSIHSLSAYTTLSAQCFSPDGQHLAVGQSDPNSATPSVVIFDVLKLVDKDTTGDNAITVANNRARAKAAVTVRFALQGKGKPILALATTKTELIVGSTGDVSAYPWKDLLKRAPKRSWHLVLPPQPGAAMETEVNWIEIEETSRSAGRILVAGGDNLVHVFDLETREQLQTLEGHQNYLHGLSHVPGTNTVSSCSEDGTVKIWDTGINRPCVHTLTPSERPELQRPALGKWVGALSMTQEWLGCGGGPSAALWHLRTLSPQEPLPPFDAGVHVIKLHQGGDRVIIGGETNKLYQTNLSGQILAEVQLSSSCVYSVACQEAPVKMLTAVGSSSRVDICAPNFSYRDQSIEFPLQG